MAMANILQSLGDAIERQQQRKRADQEQTDLKSTHFRFVLLFYASLADSALGPCFISRRSSPMKMSA